ncbi:thioredoxin domain-containing protein [Dyadobacter sp. CY351]|uniref:thioredoxin domain-containing protein n=1 Tax=Dyadobacter sp. CY351 TaxID=2909337 RepID=UPI001F2EAD26|nr:thioredoxin domain-containing protein [Dyadobacter sp. CY351]MCF2516486.1 thioredoxin domain-containing protein [Dyadobacter sp. CY351]
MIFVVALGVMISSFSCKKQQQNGIIAKVEGDEISMDEIDALIKSSLYEYLFAIYDVRRIALNEFINNKLIAKEAKAHKIDTDSVTSLKISEMKRRITKEQYIADNSLRSGVVDERNPFKLIPLDTPEGQRVLEESYVKFLTHTFAKELRAKYKVDILLTPPETPKLDLRGIVSYKRGNLQSQHSVTIVSDFDCPVCQSKEPVLKKIFKKYGERVRFDYVHLSSSINKSILFSECAGKQRKFWEAHEALFQKRENGFSKIENLISDLNLDKTACEACMQSEKVAGEINVNMERLRSLGIIVTPTIIVNNRIYYGEISEEVMGQFIEKSLK